MEPGDGGEAGAPSLGAQARRFYINLIIREYLTKIHFLFSKTILFGYKYED